MITKKFNVIHAYIIAKNASKLNILGLNIDTLKYDELLNVESYEIISQSMIW